MRRKTNENIQILELTFMLAECFQGIKYKFYSESQSIQKTVTNSPVYNAAMYSELEGKSSHERVRKQPNQIYHGFYIL
jgi:hypothetical protein